MSVAKVVEIVGNSPENWQSATQNAVKEASKTIRNIHGVKVVGMTAKVRDGKILEYRTTVKIAFGVEK